MVFTKDAELRWGGVLVESFCSPEAGRWNNVYLHFKKGRAKRWPLVNDLQEGKFGFFSAFSRVFVVD